MEILEAINNRHSVRSYLDTPIEEEKLKKLNMLINTCNKEGDLNIQLVTNEPNAFDCFMAHYGKFSGVKNYIVLIGKKSKDLQEKLGYYGEKIALEAQMLGLNTCWVAMTYKKVKTAFTIGKGEKLVCVLALGYGKSQGLAHKIKKPKEVANINNTPDWFKKGIDSALLAPTAMNQQKFRFTLQDNKVSISTKAGFYTKVDMGIAKYHFEVGAGKDNFEWA